MMTTTDKTYLISNTHLDTSTVVHNIGDVYECIWILFAETLVIDSVRGDWTAPRIEIYKYIDDAGVTETGSKIIAVDDARAEWRFWIGQGFQRITDKDNKGWKYTGDIRNRTGINKLAKAPPAGMPLNIDRIKFRKKIAAEISEINERETA
jgi:hypothetical protein|tara:strand:- start:2005 stop:2457 length:453 start_codon:yes stop_codon:yes gene_type:complete